VSFEPDTGRFEANLTRGASVSRDRVVELVMEHSKKRGENYQIRFGEPTEQLTGEVTSRAEAFTLPTLGGEHYNLGTVIGQRPIVLVFWASWCAPCLEEAPHLVELHGRYAEQVEFISVSIDASEDHPKLRSVASELKIPYPVALDPDGEVLAKYASGTGIPLTFVIGRDGKVAYQHGNYEPGDEQALAEAIQSTLDDVGEDK